MSRPLRVLYIGTLPPHPGGTAIVGSQLVVGLAARGHAVAAVAPLAEGIPDPDDGTRFPGVAVERYPVRSWELRPSSGDQRLARDEAAILPQRVAAALERHRPDVAVLGRESFARDVPPVIRVHGVPLVQIAHAASAAGALNGTIPAEARDRILAHLRMADHLVVIARNLEPSYRPLGVPLTVIQNGVDLGRFRPRPRDAALAGALGIGRGDVVVGHVSNLKDLKRPLDIVASAALAIPRVPALRYLIVGDGPGRREIAEAVRAAGLADRFTFVGWVEHSLIDAYYTLTDLVVMPSEREALALAYLETMASGRLLIASDLPASREVIEHGRNGHLHPVGDMDALAELTVASASDPAGRAAMAMAARSTAESFGLPRVLDQFEGLLLDVAAARVPLG